MSQNSGLPLGWDSPIILEEQNGLKPIEKNLETSLLLALEPIPNSSWGYSLANLLPKNEWEKIRKEAYKKANWTCQACGKTGVIVHCHECWSYEDKKKIQILTNLRVLCKTCHDVVHFGRSCAVYKKNYVSSLIKHWCKVNGLKDSDFYKHQKDMEVISKKRVNKIYRVVAYGREIA